MITYFFFPIFLNNQIITIKSLNQEFLIKINEFIDKNKFTIIKDTNNNKKLSFGFITSFSEVFDDVFEKKFF